MDSINFGEIAEQEMKELLLKEEITTDGVALLFNDIIKKQVPNIETQLLLIHTTTYKDKLVEIAMNEKLTLRFRFMKDVIEWEFRQGGLYEGVDNNTLIKPTIIPKSKIDKNLTEKEEQLLAAIAEIMSTFVWWISHKTETQFVLEVPLKT